MWWCATRMKRKKNTRDRQLSYDSSLHYSRNEGEQVTRLWYLWMFFSHQPECTCPSNWHRLTLIKRMEYKVRGEVVRQKKHTQKTQKTPFIAHPTLAQPICKRQVTLQLAILQTKQMNEALQVAQKGKGNVFQHPIHSDIEHQQNFHKGCFILKGKGVNA